MNGPEHYREAEALLAIAERHITEDPRDMRISEVSADAAQVHATLALAAATIAVNLPISDAAWREVAGPKPDGGE